MSIALALGQIEEAMGLIDGRKIIGFDLFSEAGRKAAVEGPHYYSDVNLYHAYKALVRARDLLAEATAAEAAMVPVAHYTPITAEEIGP